MTLMLLSFLFVASALAYQVPITDLGKFYHSDLLWLIRADYSRQICSGMWANDKTYINGVHRI